MARRSTDVARSLQGKASPSLLYAIKQVELAVRSHLDDLLRPIRLTALQYTALTVLQRRSGLTTAELARNSFVTPQAMADLVEALERRELIERHRNPDNKRQLHIALTASGHELVAQYSSRVAELEARMLQDLDATDRSRLRDLLDRCRGSLADHPPV